LAWNVDFNDTAKHQLAKLDRQWQAAILDYLEDRIATLDDPRSRGKPLVGDKKGLWRYRVGDYRILCELRDNELVVLVVTIGHRRRSTRTGTNTPSCSVVLAVATLTSREHAAPTDREPRSINHDQRRACLRAS